MDALSIAFLTVAAAASAAGARCLILSCLQNQTLKLKNEYERLCRRGQDHSTALLLPIGRSG